jgi:hypothetical protein
MRFRTSVYLVLAVGLSTISVQPVSAAVQTNIKVPIDIGVFIPCAADGAGEVVFLTGNLHILLRFTMDQAGGIHVASHFQPQGISGNGQTTGDKYQGTGVTKMSSTRRLELKKRSSTISASWAKDRETTSSFTKLSTLRLAPMAFRPHPSIISASIADSFRS